MAIDTPSKPEAESPSAPTIATRPPSGAVPDRRAALARAVVAILAKTVRDEHRLTIQLDGDADSRGEAGLAADTAAGARVQAVLDQLLDGAGGALDHLAGGDLADQLRRQRADALRLMSSHGQQIFQRVRAVQCHARRVLRVSDYIGRAHAE